MLVNSRKLKKLRLAKNWTQQHLAQVCDLSMRTIQRVEKDGVASNETVAAYAAVFEVAVDELLLTAKAYQTVDRKEVFSKKTQAIMALLFVGGFAAGIGLTLWLV